MPFKLEPRRYDFDCRTDPAYDPWASPANTGGAVQSEAVVGTRCAGNECTGRVAQVRLNTHAMLAPFCATCRHRGHVAIHRGYATAETVGAWLKTSRRFTGRAA